MPTTEDGWAIARPIQSYFRCLEEGDYEGLRDVFTDDVVGGWGPDGDIPLVGVDAIIEHVRGAAAFTSPTFIGRPPSVEIDGATASAETGSVGYFIGHPPRELTTSRARYRDHLRNTHGRWLIDRRDHKELWRASAPLVMLNRELGAL